MDEALVKLILEQLATITIKQIEEEVKLIVGVDKEVENLILHLNNVQAVLQDAEERQMKEANVRNWLRNLEELSYHINDVLDEWNTEILKHQIQIEEKEGEKKVRSSIQALSVCFWNISDNSPLRHNIAMRIKNINERLTLIATLRQNYRFEENISRVGDQLENRPKTSSFVDVSSIVGREEEKENLINILRETSEEERSRFVIPVVGIVGIGGLGKTAFAQFVYNDKDVGSLFDETIWVCVSIPFDPIKIAKAIFEVLDKNDSRAKPNEFDTLIKGISKSINGKKFLLVLDDVWSPSNDQWEPLMEALRNSRQAVEY